MTSVLRTARRPVQNLPPERKEIFDIVRLNLDILVNKLILSGNEWPHVYENTKRKFP